MAAVLFEDVFDQILLGTAKNRPFLKHFFNFTLLRPPNFEDSLTFLTLHLFLVYGTWISKNLESFG